MAYQHFTSRSAYANSRKSKGKGAAIARINPVGAMGAAMAMAFLVPMHTASAMMGGGAKTAETAYHDELEQSPAERENLSAPWQDWGF